jgi:hypothetical protein
LTTNPHHWHPTWVLILQIHWVVEDTWADLLGGIRAGQRFRGSLLGLGFLEVERCDLIDLPQMFLRRVVFIVVWLLEAECRDCN